MGEGLRKPGDRGKSISFLMMRVNAKRMCPSEDISSDDEDDFEAERRHWPRDPLKGAPLAIARLWLARVIKSYYLFY